MQRLAARFTYANVMSTIAVFLALGGVAWASTQLPANSVGRQQLRKDAVTSAKVKDGSLTAADLKPGTLLAGPAGPAGAPGADGAKGEQGPAGIGPAYSAARDVLTPLTLSSTMSAVATSPTLPAGSYVVIGRANLYAGASAAQFLCALGDDAAQAVPLAASAELPLTMASTVTLTAPGVVSLSCYQQAGTVHVAQASVIATRVTAVNPK